MSSDSSFHGRGVPLRAPVCVLKFGGTSVGSGERIRRVAEIVVHTLRDPDEAFPVVVVSAMSGITDQLLRIAAAACSGATTRWEQELEMLREKHLEAAEEIIQTGRPQGDPYMNGLEGRPQGDAPTMNEDRIALHRNIERAIKQLRQDIEALRETVRQKGDITLPTAAVAAWGERLSVLLVSAAIRELGVQAEAVRKEVIITRHPQSDPSQPFGVVVGADPIMEETRVNAQVLIHPLIAEQVVPVAAGFMGRTITGFVTTLGRNGSDYSATVIGAALDCVEVTIYTDVDGILTADPRLVANARLLTQLSYAEAARLSWFGAKVLHPRTLIPIAPRNIPVRVRNTFRPYVRGTVVGPEGRLRSGATAITIRRKLALITVESTDLFGAPENAGQVFALAARAGAAPVAICSSSGHHLAFVVEEQAADSVVALLQHDMDNWRVSCRRGLAACACIGSGFTADPMSAARAITALARERIPVITQGASEQGIALIVEDRDSESALRCLHRDLIAPVIPLVRHAITIEQKKREINA